MFVRFVENLLSMLQHDQIRNRVDLKLTMIDRIIIEPRKLEMPMVVHPHRTTNPREILINRDNCEKSSTIADDDDEHSMCVRVCLLLFIMKSVRYEDNQPRNIFSLIRMRTHCLTLEQFLVFLFFAFSCKNTIAQPFPSILKIHAQPNSNQFDPMARFLNMLSEIILPLKIRMALSIDPCRT